MLIKTFHIEKIGRLYLSAKINGEHNCKIIMNKVVSDFKAGDIVALEVRDLSTRNNYGSVLKYHPITIRTALEAEQAAFEALIYRNIGWAEKDMKNEIFNSNAITFILDNESRAVTEDCMTAISEFVAEMNVSHENHKQAMISRNMIKAERGCTDEVARYLVTQMRELHPVSNRPEFHVAIRKGDDIIIYTGAGSTFKIGEDAHLMHGDHLKRFEGEQGSYCYYRKANEQEIADMELKEENKPKQVYSLGMRENGVLPDGLGEYLL